MSQLIRVKVRKLPHFPQDLSLQYGTECSSGIDLIAAIEKDVIIKPFERMLVPTGISIAMPPSFEAQVRSRSGLALKYGLAVLNSPGTIDNDYRGEISIILINFGNLDFTICPKMKIAQLVFSQFSQANLVYVDYLSDTNRGNGGFGSTGI